MTSLKWRLLGFDARETDEQCQKMPIPEAIREGFLLRPEVSCPFSVDRHIWPTHFLYHPQILHMIRQSFPPLIDTDPDCEGGLWLNLAKMRKCLAENERLAVIVSVELLAPVGASVAEYPSSLIYTETDPRSLPVKSTLLGYDVADAGFWSGLSNCGYSGEERTKLRPQWRDRINDFGLLKSEPDAVEFRKLSDARVPEHAPFWVYKLSRLPEL
jgi:hypothetical protein